MKERFRLSFPASAAHLRPLREWCRVFLRPSLPTRDLEAIALAVSEACANTIEHCFAHDACREVQIEFEVSQSRVVVRVRNYCLAAVAHRLRPREAGKMHPRGLGLKFIEASVDRVDYEEQGDGYLALAMTKRRRARGR